MSLHFGAEGSIGTLLYIGAIVGDPACDQDHKTAQEVNYAATRMMIEIAKGEQVQRFIFASSCSVYGASEQIMDEKSQVAPISLYADTKVDSEEALLAAANGGFHPTILRFATIFGLSPRPRFDLVVNLLTAKAMKDRVVTIYNGEQDDSDHAGAQRKDVEAIAGSLQRDQRHQIENTHYGSPADAGENGHDSANI